MGRRAPPLAFGQGVLLPEGVVLHLPEAGRERLALPFAEVFEGKDIASRVEGARAVAAVGDVTAGEAVRRGVRPRFIVVDFKTKRGPVPQDDAVRTYGDEGEKVRSAASTITAALYNAVARAAGRGSTTRIEVEGEEDLAVMPAIIHMEAGATVLYGLPDRGVTAVKVDDESRRLAREFLERFVVERAH